MERQDDPTIDGDIVLLRRIPPQGDRVQWGEDGNPTPASQNFRDKDNELSTYRADETSCEAVLAGHAGFGIVQFTAGQVRQLFAESNETVVICRDESDPLPGHVIICGKVTGGMSKKFKKFATWVPGRWPARIPPDQW